MIKCYCAPRELCEGKTTECLTNTGCFNTSMLAGTEPIQTFGCFKDNSLHMRMMCTGKLSNEVITHCCATSNFCNKGVNLTNISDNLSEKAYTMSSGNNRDSGFKHSFSTLGHLPYNELSVAETDKSILDGQFIFTFNKLSNAMIIAGFLVSFIATLLLFYLFIQCKALWNKVYYIHQMGLTCVKHPTTEKYTHINVNKEKMRIPPKSPECTSEICTMKNDELIKLNNQEFMKKVMQTSGSGRGLPLLVPRTIARQVELGECIGKGRYGEVWRGRYEDENVAVKIFSSLDESSWLHETQMFSKFQLHHRNILAYIASDITSRLGSTQLWMIFQYHASGSLYDYLQNHVVQIAEAVKLMVTAASGLSYLHGTLLGIERKPSIVHGDIKSKNILVKDNGTCCISDLGLAVAESEHSSNLLSIWSSKVGTRRYLSPEILEAIQRGRSRMSHEYQVADLHKFQADQQNNLETFGGDLMSIYIDFETLKASDIYAFSLVMWEILQRCEINGDDAERYALPYSNVVGPDPSLEEMYNAVCCQNLRPLVAERWRKHPITGRLENILKECWSGRPEARLPTLRLKKTLNRLLF